MEDAGEHSTLNLEPTIEQTPFKDSTVQTTFNIWCTFHGDIRPKYIDRQIWEERTGENKLLEKKEDGTTELYIPQDLHLWDMVDVMEAVDSDTFSYHPERRTAKAEELRHLGETFEHAGIYIAQRLGSIKEGKALAEELAVQFYNYGHSLSKGVPSEAETSIADLGVMTLFDEELEGVDQWLAGDEFYQAKIKKLEDARDDNP
ncbi:MAG: hypothetical protein ACREHC_05615, partial [Candidatus Levyibacteriota bacterium]